MHRSRSRVSRQPTLDTTNSIGACRPRCQTAPQALRSV
jgi:hypothetical protein